MLARIRERKDQDGFTLIELLVVMIIIGILAAIAIPIFLNQRAKAHDSAIKSDLRTAATQIESDYVNNQEYPIDADGATLISKLTPSDNVTITYKVDADATKGFCLTGKSTDTNTTTFYWDNSQGGMLPTGGTCD